MLAEFDQVQGRRARWRFSLGCAWAASRIRLQSPEPGGAGLRAVILGCAVLSLALVGYGLVHYPGLRSEPNVWGAMIVFLATLLTYAGLAIVLARGVSQQAIAARRFGLSEALPPGPAGCSASHPPAALKGWVFLPLLIALIGPAMVATVAARRSRDSRTGNLTALWSGLVAGLDRVHRLGNRDLRERRRPLRRRPRQGLPQQRSARSPHLRESATISAAD